MLLLIERVVEVRTVVDFTGVQIQYSPTSYVLIFTYPNKKELIMHYLSVFCLLTYVMRISFPTLLVKYGQA